MRYPANVLAKKGETWPPWRRGGSRNFIWEPRGAEGADVERRRREDRGAAGAEGMGCGEGCPPPHWGRGLGRGLCPLPRIFFSILHYKMACFGRFWCATCTVDRCCQIGNVHVKCEMSMTFVSLVSWYEDVQSNNY